MDAVPDTTRGHFIAGASAPASSGESLQEFDPRTGEASFRIARGSAADVDAAAKAAAAAWPQWRDRRPMERGRILVAIAAALRAGREALADIECRETGRPRWHAYAEVETAAQYFEFYGGLATVCHGEVIDLGAGYHSYTRREPFGVIGIILPWNAPLNQAARGIAPALASGNAVVAKPSEFTSVTLIEAARIACEQCGLPAGLLNVVTGTGREVGMAIAEHLLVRKVAFTGSVRVGRELGHVAAERIIPIGLELGGKSPNIVFADADLDKAADGVVRSFTFNAGQVCSAGSRCLVERAVIEPFMERLRARLDAVPVGSGEGCAMGPIITRAQLDRVRGYLKMAQDEGICVTEGGRVTDAEAFDRGWYVRPVVLSGIDPQAPLAREEIFGPVVSVIPFEDEAEAIRLANDTEYGLVAGLWTASLQRAHRVAAAVEAGQIFVNEYFAGGVETPFGGYKSSGHGREKGAEALLHYTQVKCVTMKL